MRRRPRLLLLCGEASLLAVVFACIIGGWEARLNQDGRQGLHWLTALRMAEPLPAMAIAAPLFAIAFSLAAALLRRPRSADAPRFQVIARAVTLPLLATAGTAGGVAIVRRRILPLLSFSTPRLSATVLTLLAAALVVLFVLRLTDAGGSRIAAGSAPGAARRALGHLRSAVAVAGLAALAGGLFFCWGSPAFGASRATGHPPVIIVSIDTLRADRTGFLGSSRPLTPRLDDLAAQGVIFEQASAAAPWTLPSHVSLFTSLLPFDHHVRWSWMRIDPERSMLAERFRDAGYRTGAFTGDAYVNAHFGFAQGFEVYSDHDELVEGGPEVVAAEALRWVRGVRDQPFLLFLHTYEPHSPYVRDTYAKPADAGRLPGRITFTEVEAIQSGRLVLTETERRYVRDLYDGDVHHADEVFGGFLDTLREEGILDRAVLVVLSDHGEDLWDHDSIRSPGHGHSLYEELLHVPLIVRAPGRIVSGRRLRTPVSLLDVAPTLLDLAGLPPDPKHTGRTLGGSLRRGVEPAPVPILAESVEYGPDRFSHREGNLKAILTPTPHVQHHDLKLQVQPLEVFDLAADPGEHDNLAAHPTDETSRLVRELRARAAQRLFGARGGPEAHPDLPEEIKRQLRSLGYIQ
jgi:arylsulfatase A-like enzyme